MRTKLPIVLGLVAMLTLTSSVLFDIPPIEDAHAAPCEGQPPLPAGVYSIVQGSNPGTCVGYLTVLPAEPPNPPRYIISDTDFNVLQEGELMTAHVCDPPNSCDRYWYLLADAPDEPPYLPFMDGEIDDDGGPLRLGGNSQRNGRLRKLNP